MRVEKKLKKAPGVTDAAVNLATERASVTLGGQATLMISLSPSNMRGITRSP